MSVLAVVAAPDLAAALTGAADAVFGPINAALPVAAPIGLGIIGLFAGWKFVKRMIKG